MFASFRAAVEAALDRMESAGELPPGLDRARITVEPPRDPAHGDLSTNAALVLAAPAGLAPPVLAERLVRALRGAVSNAGGGLEITAMEVAGPGFINVRLGAPAFLEVLRQVLRPGGDFAASARASADAPAKERGRINVEYVSANPTGPLHVGHTRGAVFGDALARLLERTGSDVCREYYVNDGGAQVDALARSVFLRYREALGEEIGPMPGGLYPGGYLKPVGAMLARTHGAALRHMAEDAWMPVVRAAAVAAMMDLICADLAALGIRHDVFSSERALVEAGRLDDMLEVLRAQDLVYEGSLAPPRSRERGGSPEPGGNPEPGGSPEPGRDAEAAAPPAPHTLFRATAFGDDRDRVLRRGGGGWTYFAADAAYHLDKARRGFTRMIDVWGADHGGYVARMRGAVAAVTGGRAELDVKVCQLVRLMRGGRPVKMSKRGGNFVTLRQLVDEVGADAVRFLMLTRRNDAVLDFDFVRAVERSQDNPVFYVQYAHARICSVLRNAVDPDTGHADLDASDAALAAADPSPLTHEAELALLKLLARFPRLLEAAANAHEPHRVAFFVQDVAAAVHALWNKGKEDPGLRFIVRGDRRLTLARLALLRAAARIIAEGLDILGVTPVEEMR